MMTSEVGGIERTWRALPVEHDRFVRAYGPQAKQMAERLIDANYYELIGSDCHQMGHIEAIRHTLTRPYLHKVLDSGKLLNATL